MATTTVFIGNYFEWTGSTSTMKKYYYLGSLRIALRTGAGGSTTGLQWLISDHLGSTSKVPRAALPTQYTYTGQYSHVSDFGLLYINAVWHVQ